jgi:CheY-like chemotaxis protein
MKEPFKILIVDDSEIDRFVHKKLLVLNQISHDVDECKNGKEALEYFRAIGSSEEKLPDIVLLDVLMPEMDGFEFLEAMNKREGNVANRPFCCILTSINDQRELSRLHERPGVQGVLRKPLNTAELEHILMSTSNP